MKHLIKQQAWNCTPVAFAMALGVSTQEIFESVGHDGSEIVVAGLCDPVGRRGFHIQELIAVVLDKGMTATPFQMLPQSSVSGKIVTIEHRIEQFNWLVENEKGVLRGQGGNTAHCVAFESGEIFDPDGPVYEYNLEACSARGFHPTEVWVIK